MHRRVSVALATIVLLAVSAAAPAQRRRGGRLFRKKCTPCPAKCVATTSVPAITNTCTQVSVGRNCVPHQAVGSSCCGVGGLVYSRQLSTSSQSLAQSSGCGCSQRIAGRIFRPVGPPGTVIPGNMIPPNGFIQEPNGRLIPSTPFSLSGYVIPPPGQSGGPPEELSNFCEQAFFACCASGAPNCVSAYHACCQARNETILHTRCPIGGPGGGGGGGEPELQTGQESVPQFPSSTADEAEASED